MTKYVLNSGGIKNEPLKAKKYFAELLNGLGENPKLLWCFFAAPSDESEYLYYHYKKMFLPSFPADSIVTNTLASVDNFIKQVKDCDVVYIHGGDYEILSNYTKGLDFPNSVKNKVVGLNSASAMLFSASSWSCDTFELKPGLGILPLKFIPHYKATKVPNGSIVEIGTWEAAKKELEEYGDKSLPVYALEEGDFLVFEK